MNPTRDMSGAVAAPGHDTADPACAAQAATTGLSPPGLPAELAQLFRHSLREGRIHPLMPLVLRYRQACAEAAAAAAAEAAAASAATGPAP